MSLHRISVSVFMLKLTKPERAIQQVLDQLAAR
jgi:hypothetical protein